MWHAGILSDQGLNPHPLQWKRGVLTTGLQGKFLSVCFLTDLGLEKQAGKYNGRNLG